MAHVTTLDTGKPTPAEAASFLQAHERLKAHYDVNKWHWTAETPAFDICLGCILVQHTSWSNVERALVNVRAAGIESMRPFLEMPEEEVVDLIRPSGTPVVKARRLRALAELVESHGGFDTLFDRPVGELRALLLATYGVGPETADAVCLYAAHQPVVVHDAYTARLCRRLGIGPGSNAYEAWRAWLDAILPRDYKFRYDNHASIVVHCKELCRVKPKCEVCPLANICAYNNGGNG